jgi:hypothetical protein
MRDLLKEDYMFQSVTQKHGASCAVACVAWVLKVSKDYPFDTILNTLGCLESLSISVSV